MTRARVLVRHTGHRAALAPGWMPHGDGRPVSVEVAELLAMSIRTRGHEARIEEVEGERQVGLFGGGR